MGQRAEEKFAHDMKWFFSYQREAVWGKPRNWIDFSFTLLGGEKTDWFRLATHRIESVREDRRLINWEK